MNVTRLKCDYADRYTAKRQPNCDCLECANKWAAAGGNLITLQDFWRFCRSHDWTYQMSDDGRAYRAGRDNEAYLKTLAKELGPQAEKILAQWTTYHAEGIAVNHQQPDFPLG